MQIAFELDDQEVKAFFPYLTQVRNRAAKELTAKQREVDIANMTSVVSTLGKLSRAIKLAEEAKAVVDAACPPGSQVIDLMAALKASLARKGAA